ncbi:MAG TPA: hypothetical protein ENN19_06165 [Chloroflexi bacterium]|nr:hypothetical protein [Chloroflexota bacterium]
MQQKHFLNILAGIGLVLAILACNAPTPTPVELSPSPGGVESQDTPLPSATQPPIDTPTLETLSETPTPTVTETLTETPTETPTELPTSTKPVSSGPLDFTPPTTLDHWEPTGAGEMTATFTVEIIGGAPPYDLYHDVEYVKTTWKTNPQITFRARGCSGIVHTITVKSADGQIVKHDYWISPPWCEN